MSRYSIFFFVFFLQLIITSPYTLVGRSGHTASYMDNKIYFLGGYTEKYFSGTNDFFYLDVSKPFNLDSTLPISDLSNDSRYVNAYGKGVSTICDPNKDTIFLICEVSEKQFYYRFINKKEWDMIPFPSTNQWTSAVCNKNGTYIYIYGRGSGVNNDKYMMKIINTTKTNWYLESYDSNIVPKYLASAILLPDGRIAYIGEIINDFRFNFRNICIYDTNDGTWINMNTSGIEPSPRYFHTAVLTQDGLIIIYGGGSVRRYYPVPDQISVLDTNVNPFNWSTPSKVNTAPSSAPFGGHTATLVGNYMIIAFGHYRNTTHDIVYSDQIHMIDVSEKNNYKWVKSFTPNNTYTIESASTTESENATKSPGAAHAAIIGGTTGGIATIIIIVSVSYLLYRRKRTVIYAPQAKHAINC